MRIHSFRVVPALPERLRALRDIAMNLLWSWDDDLRVVFSRLDRDLWDQTYQNPVLMLGTIAQERLEARAQDESFLSYYQRALERLHAPLREPTWWERRVNERPLVAYFSAEYGIAECLPIYSRTVEGHNFDIRKQLLEYHDVANDQRKVIYEQRNELMAQSDISETINAIRVDVVNGVVDLYIPVGSIEEQWDIAGLTEAMVQEFNIHLPIQQWLDTESTLAEEGLRKRLLDEVVKAYQEKEAQAGSSVLRHFEKAVMLQVLDTLWKEHLAAMDYLRQGIHLRGYAQKNPKQEYKRGPRPASSPSSS